MMNRQTEKTGDLSRELSRETAVFVLFHYETWNTLTVKKLNGETARDAELSQFT